MAAAVASHLSWARSTPRDRRNRSTSESADSSMQKGRSTSAKSSTWATGSSARTDRGLSMPAGMPSTVSAPGLSTIPR